MSRSLSADTICSVFSITEIFYPLNDHLYISYVSYVELVKKTFYHFFIVNRDPKT